MAGWYVDADKYPISSWFLGCMEKEINDHVQDERKRIVKSIKNRVCFDHLNGCDHAACYALSDLIELIEKEEK